MSIERNKAVAREFFARFGRRDIAGILELLGDDLAWWSAGKPELVPITGVRDKKHMERIFRSMDEQLEDGLAMTVKGMTAEDDRVAVEVESYGRLKNGRVYNNEYHLLLTLREGRIVAAKEYYDTHHVQATWFQA